MRRLGFSRNRYWQFKRLADDFDRLPALRKAVADGRVGWTKAQQVARVATPGNDAGWVDKAQHCSRRELTAAVAAEVARVRGEARAAVAADATTGTDPEASTDPRTGGHQLALSHEAPPADCAKAMTPTPDSLAIPATVSLRADALQVARFESLVEQARKRGIAPAQVAALTCDARIAEAGKPNRATIPPRVRRAVLARDRHRCATPGCGATAFLEVHHVTPSSRGGSNKPANLVTMCGRCHAFVHEQAVAPAQVRCADTLSAEGAA